MKRHLVLTILTIIIFLGACKPLQVTEPVPVSTVILTSVPTEKVELATLKPTATRTPTKKPTQRPTKKPTDPPSIQPTISPTSRPTTIPQKTLTPTPEWQLDDYGPIAFLKPQSIYMVDPDGSNERAYFKNPNTSKDFGSKLAWSPDGMFIAYALSPYPDIYLLNIDTKKTENITRTEFKFEFEPDFSPNGLRIAYSSNLDGKFDIYTMNKDGSNIKRVTKDCNCRYPSWSPDGKKIVYYDWDDFSIYIMNSDGSNIIRLTTGGMNVNPAWTPDGKSILFIRSSGDVGSQAYVYRMNPDGSGLTALTDERVWPRTFDISPDGRYLIIHNVREGAGMWSAIILFDLETDLIKSVVREQDDVSMPAWSPIYTGTTTGSGQELAQDCTNGWTRLSVGEFLRVIGDPNRVRSEPKKADNVIGEIHSGVSYKIVGGPICADGLVFYKIQDVSLPEGIGWTAEGDLSEYYLEPAKQ